MENFKNFLTPKRFLELIVFIVIVIFGFSNMEPTIISFIFFSVKIPVLVLILGIYAIGVVTGWSIKRSDIKKVVADIQR